eukprot:TRINITY_DN1610_c0_g1_i1.p1 TRINITY_DN1610_c0_g1~~TRINITY_DN1610_c0_g1_i1.p1  ORF type:complete len:516 (+),score=53.49 TRINITY_DN1610_c0_g1_i1:757-2304(+)
MDTAVHWVMNQMKVTPRRAAHPILLGLATVTFTLAIACCVTPRWVVSRGKVNTIDIFRSKYLPAAHAPSLRINSSTTASFHSGLWLACLGSDCKKLSFADSSCTGNCFAQVRRGLHATQAFSILTVVAHFLSLFMLILFCMLREKQGKGTLRINLAGMATITTCGGTVFAIILLSIFLGTALKTENCGSTSCSTLKWRWICTDCNVGPALWLCAITVALDITGVFFALYFLHVVHGQERDPFIPVHFAPTDPLVPPTHDLCLETPHERTVITAPIELQPQGEWANGQDPVIALNWEGRETPLPASPIHPDLRPPVPPVLEIARIQDPPLQRQNSMGGSRQRQPLGIQLQRETTELVLLTVAPGSPADISGLRIGDVIMRWNGDQVNDTAHFQQLLRAPESTHGFLLGVLRGTEMLNIAVPSLLMPVESKRVRFDETSITKMAHQTPTGGFVDLWEKRDPPAEEGEEEEHPEKLWGQSNQEDISNAGGFAVRSRLYLTDFGDDCPPPPAPRGRPSA